MPAQKENYYILLGLDPSVTDQVAVDEKINEMEKKWRDLVNKLNKPEHKRLLELVPEIRKRLSDPVQRKAEAKAAVFAAAIDPAKLEQAEKALPGNYGKIPESLAHLNYTDVYDFLSREPASGIRTGRYGFGDTADALTDRAKELMEAYRNKGDVATDQMQLASLIADFMSGGQKEIYDTYIILFVKAALCKEIDKVIEVVGELGKDQQAKLSSSFTRLFFSQKDVGTFIRDYCEYQGYKTGAGQKQAAPVGAPAEAPAFEGGEPSSPFDMPFGSTNPNPANVKSQKNATAGLLGILFGAVGAHNFYLKRKARGFVQLGLTALAILSQGKLGILALAAGLWGVVEGVMIYGGKIDVEAEDTRFNKLALWAKEHKPVAISATAGVVAVSVAFPFILGAIGKPRNLSPDRTTTNPTMAVVNQDEEAQTPVTSTTSAPIIVDNRVLLGRDLAAIQSNRYALQADVSLGGKQYQNALVFEGHWNEVSYANFNLDRQYTAITGTFGHVDETAEGDVTMNIYGDGKLIKSIDLKPNMFAETFAVDVTDVRLLKFEAPKIENGSGTKYAFTDMELSTDTNIQAEETSALNPVVSENGLLLGRDLTAIQSNRYESQSNTTLGGKQCNNTLVFEGHWNEVAYANFNLDKQYSTITGIFGHVDGTVEGDVTMNIYGDGKLIKSVDLKPNMFAEAITLDVVGVRLLKFEAPKIANGSGSKYAFSNMELFVDSNAPEVRTQSVIDRNALVLGFDVEGSDSNRFATESTVLLGGIRQFNALVFEGHWNEVASANFNLDKKYSTITGIFGHVDGTVEGDVTINIYGDGKLIKSINLKPNMFTEAITLDVKDVRLLKFEAPKIQNGSGTKYAFCNMILK